MHNLVIKGAEVADGSGAPLRIADVAVSDGRVTEGGRVDGAAKQSTDADLGSTGTLIQAAGKATGGCATGRTSTRIIRGNGF